jgi:hypothetical protein
VPRKKFEPTEELRRKVKALVGFGVSRWQICTLIGIKSTKTLRKYFRKELESGVVEAVAAVQRTALRLATSGRNPRMTRRWLERYQQRSRGRQIGHEPERPRHVKWIVETYQPPRSPEDEMAVQAMISQLRNADSTGPGWDGDDALGDDPK